MHDPLTLAFRIRIPLRRFPVRNATGALLTYMREHLDLLEVWHVDPCRDGSDDSCGWSYARTTAAQDRAIDALVDAEAAVPKFTRHLGKRLEDPGVRLVFADDLVDRIATALRVRLRREQLDELGDYSAAHDDFAYLPGWHENSTDPQRERELRARWARRWFGSVASRILTEARPWWRHPRWHVWHWRVRQPHCARAWRRLTDRCSYCRRRFGYFRRAGEVQYGWDSAWHARCGKAAVERMRAEGTLPQ